METYTFDLASEAGMADSDFLDRMAEFVYSDERLISPALGLGDDGAVSMIFTIEAESVREAMNTAMNSVTLAIAAAHDADSVRVSFDLAADLPAPPLERLSVERTDNRELVPA